MGQKNSWLVKSQGILFSVRENWRSISGDCVVSDVLFLNEDSKFVVRWLEGIAIRGDWRPLLIWHFGVFGQGKVWEKPKK